MRPSVLIVEDDDTLRRAQCIYLTRKGLEVFEARDGVEGVEKARADLPDVVIMDIMLPRMNGIMATRRLKEEERTATIPVIASTGAVLGDLRLEDGGFAAVLFKPYGLGELLATLQRFLEFPPPG
jgi:two-component system, cell cycle response regulator DivK